MTDHRPAQTTHPVDAAFVARLFRESPPVEGRDFDCMPETDRHVRVITGTGNAAERRELGALCRGLSGAQS